MNARKLTLTALVTGVVAMLGWSASASAQLTHPYVSQLTGFANPTALATGVAGDLFVADTGNLEVDRFNSSGLPVSFTAVESYVSGSHLTGTPAGPFEQPHGVAVNTTTGDIYVADGERHVVDVFSATGEYLSQLTGTPGSAPVSGEFQDPFGLTVDQATGDLYVTDPHNDVVDVFNATGTYVRQFGAGVLGGSYGESIAVNELTGTAYVGDSGTDEVYVFDSSGAEITPAWHGASTPDGSFGGGYVYVGIDPSSGHVYSVSTAFLDVAEFSASTAEEYVFRLTGIPGESFSLPQAVAVSSSTGELYIADATGKVDVFGAGVVIPDVALTSASARTAHVVTLNGTVAPDGAGAATCSFEYGATSTYGHSVPCAAPVPSGNSPVPVSAAVSGLQPHTTYHYRLLASNTNGTNATADGEFIAGGPAIVSESSTEAAADSATLLAEVDPNGADTHYYFQYGTSTAYGSDLPAAPGADIPVGESQQSVGVHLRELQPATTYHYRVVVESELTPGEVETISGSDETFTTQANGTASALPDGRAWEMVTPPNKHGAGLVAVGNEQGDAIQAAADGSAITYAANSPIAVNPAGSRALELSQIFSSREAPGSWTTSDITTPHTDGATQAHIGSSSEYKLFSPDLSLGLLEPSGETPLAGGSPTRGYLREASGQYEAILKTPEVVGASRDLKHLIVTSAVGLTSTPGDEGGLYEWSEGQLRFASVLPGGQVDDQGGQLGWHDLNVRNTVSDDGSHIVFNDSGHLYLRDMARGESVQIDAAQGTPEPAGANSLYATADATGSRVFFTSTERLTADSSATEGSDLYEFEVTSGGAQPLAGKLTDLTVDGNAGESAKVLGIIGASDDGSYVYFVADGVLGDGAAHGAASGNCNALVEQPAGALCNVYVAHYDSEAQQWTAPTLIAVISGEDDRTWGFNGEHQFQEMTSRVSPNGRYVAFMSDRSLTGYDNRDANSGVRDEEVFLYDSSAGRVVCASCDPTGARPVGILRGDRFNESLADYGRGNWEERWLAANVPGWNPAEISRAFYQTRYLADNGRLFFDSHDALVPGDVNGAEDVYEYEPVGVGSCLGMGQAQNSDDVFSESSGGCVGLISAGTSEEESAFMDASETGGDVFFLTSSHLLPTDRDTSIDLYDAHECTATSPCAAPAALTPPPCTTGDSCKPAPTPQPAIFGDPASATFSGAGNVAPAVAPKPKVVKSLTRAQKLARALKACAKKSKGKRSACERQAKKRYGPVRKQAKKSSSAKAGR
jgi:DNA-binding beta-propeller fold protein YncE